MKYKIYLILFIFLINNISKAQNLEETKNFIETKITELDFGNDIIPKYKPLERTVKYKFEIINNFLLVTTTIRSFDFGDVISENYLAFYIPNIISTNFELKKFSDGSHGNYFKIKTKKLSIYTYLHKEDKFKLYDFILNYNSAKKDINNNHLLYETDFEFEFQNYNSTIIEKIKKALSHLVKLNGGKVIDDLF